MKRFSLLLAIAWTLLFGSGAQSAQERCMICHGKTDLSRIEETGRKISLYVDLEQLSGTVHADRECTDCHADVVEIPHKLTPAKVNCRRCHYTGNTIGAPDTLDYDQYEHSVHGLELAAGNPDAPVCQDCHGGHDVLAHTLEKSKFNHKNIPALCGTCHIEIYATYKESVHGEALAAGNDDAPVCTNCHGEHNIQRPAEPESKVSQINVTHTCGDCHGPMGVASKYGIKADRAATFDKSFHGVAQIMDDRMVANCASCHGYHDVRSQDDPKSSIYPDNIPTTCGKEGCHPGANANFAEGEIHIDPKSEDSGLLFYISRGFMILTISVLAGLFVFIILDLFRRAKEARTKRYQ